MDGTFSTSTPQFAQLYTVHGLSNGKNIVGAYLKASTPGCKSWGYHISI